LAVAEAHARADHWFHRTLWFHVGGEFSSGVRRPPDHAEAKKRAGVVGA
jgi:hypothetical protein